MMRNNYTTDQLLNKFDILWDKAGLTQRLVDSRQFSAQGANMVKNTCRQKLQNFSDGRIYNGMGDTNKMDPMDIIWGHTVDKMANSTDMTNFSNDLSGIGALNLGTMVLSSAIKSYGLNYIAMQRPLTALTQEIVFTRLMSNGNVIYDSRYTMNPAMSMTGKRNYTVQRGAAVAAGDVTLPLGLAADVVAGGSDPVTGKKYSGPIAYKTFAIYKTDGTGKRELIASDKGSDQAQLFSGKINQHTAVAESIQLNYTTGVLELKGVTAGAAGAWEIEYLSDVIADPNGEKYQIYKPGNVSIRVEATPRPFTFEQNISDVVQMNKEMRNSANPIDYVKQAMDQLMMAYVSCMDNDISYELLDLMKYQVRDAAFASNIVDLSPIKASTSHATIRTDLMNQVMSNATNKLMNSCGRQPTALICDDRAAEEFMNLEGFEFAAENNGHGADGLLGFAYKSRIPVIKSRTLTMFTDPAFNMTIMDNILPADDGATDIGFFVAVHKDLGNEVAPLLMGDYESPYATGAGVNFNNGNQVRHTITASYGISPVSETFASVGAFKVKKHEVHFPMPQ